MKVLDLRTGMIMNAGRGYIPRAVRVVMGSSTSSEENKDDDENTTHKHDDMEHKDESEHLEKDRKSHVEKKDMPYMREGGHVMNTPVQKDDSTYWHYVEVYGYHFSKELAETAVSWLKNADKSSRIWRLSEIKDIFTRLGVKKPDNATWGDVHYIFAMCYADGFPKVYKCDSDLVKATLMHLEDPDAPEGSEFVKWLAVQKHMGHEIKWAEMM